MKSPPTNKFEKMLKEQQHQFKLDLFEQLCESMRTVFEDCEEDEPWFEIVGDKKFQFKKLEYNKMFGVAHLHYLDKDDPAKTFRISLEMKRA